MRASVTQSVQPNPPKQRGFNIFLGIIVLLMGLYFSGSALFFVGMVAGLVSGAEILSTSLVGMETSQALTLLFALSMTGAIFGVFGYSFLVAAFRLFTTPPGVQRRLFPRFFPIFFGVLLVLGALVFIVVGQTEAAAVCGGLVWGYYEVLKRKRKARAGADAPEGHEE